MFLDTPVKDYLDYVKDSHLTMQYHHVGWILEGTPRRQQSTGSHPSCLHWYGYNGTSCLVKVLQP